MHQTSDTPACALHQTSSLKETEQDPVVVVFRKFLHFIILHCHWCNIFLQQSLSCRKVNIKHGEACGNFGCLICDISQSQQRGLRLCKIPTKLCLDWLGQFPTPITQERHASARSTSPASLISHIRVHSQHAHTLPSGLTCCHPNSFPYVLHRMPSNSRGSSPVRRGLGPYT